VGACVAAARARLDADAELERSDAQLRQWFRLREDRDQPITARAESVQAPKTGTFVTAFARIAHPTDRSSTDRDSGCRSARSQSADRSNSSITARFSSTDVDRYVLLHEPTRSITTTCVATVTMGCARGRAKRITRAVGGRSSQLALRHDAHDPRLEPLP
jgi:hypothetical protein